MNRFLYSLKVLYSIIQCTGMTATLRISLISVTCIQVVLSLFIFIAGVVCGHYLSQRWRESADRNKQPESKNNSKDVESHLELQENVAYITLRPNT